MQRPTFAQIDLPAVAHNLRALRSLLDPDVEVIGVVKADAYGHGAVPVSRALAAEGVKRFGVAIPEEAITLHEAKVPGRFLILGLFFPDQAEEIVARGFEAVIGDMASAHRLDEEARRLGRRATVHLDFDTGMGRLGFPPERAVEITAALAGLGGLRIEGAMTHFPSADDPAAAEFTRGQARALGSIREQLDAAGIHIPLWHAANSAGVLWFPEAHLNAVRPGIALYGGSPGNSIACPVELRQVMTFKTTVAHVREVPAGGTISYGRTFRVTRPSRVAVLPVGYADGFSRGFSNQGHVLVHGRRAPVLGRVCMDITLVDVTDIPQARAGDEVVLYGRQGSEEISINYIAHTFDTIPHTVMTAVSARVPRVYSARDRGSTGGAPTR